MTKGSTSSVPGNFYSAKANGAIYVAFAKSGIEASTYARALIYAVPEATPNWDIYNCLVYTASTLPFSYAASSFTFSVSINLPPVQYSASVTLTS